MLDRATRFTAFATLGVVSTTQELARRALGGIEGADPELVAEETLCLTATATARAAEVGLREHPEAAQAILSVLLDFPFTYHDYLVGGAMIVQQDPTLQQASRDIYERLERKRTFYTAHLPPGQFPGERALTDKMELWMGRISPPQLPESPQKRLAKLDCVLLLLTHLKLVLAFARQKHALK
ncbi:MAG TPA: hypothetical protein VKP65_19885 [Rhodothermales bacterium]|nr:hypothetical protein [Rhodothermales bacterium]